MRKSIFLTTIVLLFLRIAAVYGQCTGSENKPVLGVDYTYKVVIGDGQTAYNGDGIYNWYVTQNTNLLEVSGKLGETNDYFLVKTETGFSTYDKIGAGDNTKDQIKLNWKEKALSSTNPFYLVINYNEQNFAGCSPNNMKVIKIEPLNTFELAIESVADADGNAYTGSADECATNVSSAKIGTDGKVTYIYGTQTLYYKITAKGFKGKWLPEIKLPELAGKADGQKYTSVQWKQGTAGTFKDFDGTLKTDGTSQELTAKANDYAEITDVAGTPIIVKIVIDNQKYEGVEDKGIQLAADGTIKDTDKSDIKGGTDTDACDPLSAFGRTAITTIKARPKITASSGEFVTEID